jgi:hypothetical protein
MVTSKGIDDISDEALVIFIGVPVLIIIALAVFAAVYTRRKHREQVKLLELPRSQRILGVIISDKASQKQTSNSQIV